MLWTSLVLLFTDGHLSNSIFWTTSFIIKLFLFEGLIHFYFQLYPNSSFEYKIQVKNSNNLQILCLCYYEKITFFKGRKMSMCHVTICHREIKYNLITEKTWDCHCYLLYLLKSMMLFLQTLLLKCLTIAKHFIIFII